MFALCRAVAAHLKVVRRRKPSSAKGTRGGKHERGIYPPLLLWGVWGSPPRIFKILSASMCVFNVCVFMLQSRFLVRKYISWRVRNQMLDKIVFRQSQFFFCIFLQHVSLTFFNFVPSWLWQSTFSTDP